MRVRERIDAARSIGGAFGLRQKKLINTLILLVDEELGDALRVLKDRRLNSSAQKNIVNAIKSNIEVLRSKSVAGRRLFSRRACIFMASFQRPRVLVLSVGGSSIIEE